MATLLSRLIRPIRYLFFWKRIPKRYRLFYYVFLISFLIILLPLIFATLRNPGQTKAAWFDDNWTYRIEIPVTAHTTAETDVYLNLTGASAIDTSDTTKFQSDCGDLRFTKKNGGLLPYFIVSGCGTSTTVVHVLIDDFPAGAQTFYYYYGNASAENGFSASDFATAASGVTIGAFGSEEKTPGPIVYWKFDDGFGNVASDSASLKKQVGLYQGPSWRTQEQCVFGKCLFFDGSNDYGATNQNSIDLSDTNVITIEFWLKWYSYANDDDLAMEFSPNYNNVNTGFIINPNESTSQQFDISFKSAEGNNTAYFTRPSANTWHHYAIVIDRSAAQNSRIVPYVDGVAVSYTTLQTGSVTGNFGNHVLYFMSRSGNTLFGNGVLDDVKIYNFARSAAQIKGDFIARGSKKGTSATLGTSVDNNLAALSNGLVGYWKLDETSGNAADSSGNATTLTNTNSTSFVRYGRFGSAADFERTSSQYFFAADNSALSLTGSVTVAAYIKPESVTGGTQFDIAGKWDSSAESYLLAQYEDEIRFYVDSSSNYVTTTAVNLNLNTYSRKFYHVVAVYDAALQTVTIYVNGQVQATTTTGTIPSSIGDTTDRFHIGAEDSSGSAANFYDGILDEVRVYNRALGGKEVLALTDYMAPPIAYWDFEETSGNIAFDKTGSGYHGTLTDTNSGNGDGDRPPPRRPGKFGNGVDMDGVDDTVSIPSSFVVPSQSGSVAFWIYSRNTWASSVDLMGAGGGGNPDFRFFISSSSDGLYGFFIGSEYRFDINATGVPRFKQWTHMTLTWGSLGTRLYVDGRVIKSDTSSSSTDPPAYSETGLTIGAFNATVNCDCMMDEIQFYNYPLSPEEVTRVMNGNHPAPGSPVGSAVAYYKFDEGYGTITRNAAHKGAAALAGSLSSTTWRTDGKFNRALAFDGTNSVVTVTNETAIDLNDNLASGSASVWIYAGSAGGGSVGQVYQKGDADTYLRVDNPSGNVLDVEAALAVGASGTADDANVNITSAITTNTWNHIVVTWKEDELVVYINGLRRGADPGLSPNEPDTGNLFIGGASGARFNGLIDEFKIYNFALSDEEIKTEYNRGSAIVLGTLSTDKDGKTASSAAERIFCPPGDTTASCKPLYEWTMNEGSGATANDTSGTGNNGTLTGGATWIRGKYGPGISFDGINDYVDTGIPNIPAVNAAQTYSVWVNYPLIPAGTTMFYCTGTGFARALCVGFTTSLIAAFTNNAVKLIAADPPPLNQWHHVLYTYKGEATSERLNKLYINGILNSNVADSPNSGAPTDANIGQWVIGSNWYTGKIDEVRHFNYEMTPAQALWEYNKGKPTAHWKFDECQGTTLNDSGGHSYSATITLGASPSIGTCTTASTAWGNGVNGKLNYSLDFDGSDDYASTSGSIIVAAEGSHYSAVSWGGWFRPATSVASKTLIEKNREFRLTTDASSQPNCSIWASGAWVTAAASDTALSLSSWQHILCTYDGATLTVYVNGRQRGTSAQTDFTRGVSVTPLSLGRDFAGTAFYTGQIDDVRVYGYPLTQQQINMLVQHGGVRFAPVTGAP